MLSFTFKNALAILAPSILLITLPTTVYAGTIALSPSSGSFPANRPFTVDLILNENTYAFNAAQAQITLSQNITVNDITLGNCGFSFIKTPSAQNLSFVGVILGGSIKNCTVYSLTLIPSGSDPALITITDGSMKRHGDAAELLTAIQPGNYTIGSGDIGSFITSIFPGNGDTNQLVPVTASAATIATGEDLDGYTISVKVTDENGQPLKNAVMTLNPQLQATDTTAQTVTTNENGIGEFKSVSPNLYTVRAQHNDKLIAEQIINAKGSDPVLAIGLQEKKQSTNFIALIIGIVGVIAVFLFFFRQRLSNLHLWHR